MKKTITIILLFISCSLIYGQERELYKVSLDSLVSELKRTSSFNIYYLKEKEPQTLFTIKSTSGNFLAVAENELKQQGYTITKIDNNWFILRNIGISTQLPSLYFQESVKSASSDFTAPLDEDTKVASFQNKVYEIGRKENMKSGKAYLSGFVKSVKTGEPIVGVSVLNENTGSYAQTDGDGFYKLLLNTGNNVLKLQGFSLEDVVLNVSMYETGSLDVIMKEKVLSLKEASISAESVNNRRSNKMGLELIRIERIKHIPSVFGESDVLKVILTLPGVKSVGEASGGFNVRGGASDQNLILYNNGTIYNPTHLFGMFSVFNPDVVSDIELYKNSIPAEYGGRISSVLDVRSREGNSKKIIGSLGVGLLTTRGHLEGPISKKTKFIVGARTTYSDWLLGLLPNNSSYKNGTASFHDINGSVSHNFNDKNSIYFYGYYSQDKFKFSIDTSYRYSNLNGSIKWRSNFSEKHSMVVSVGYDQYDYTTFDTSNSVNAYRLKFGIKEGFAKINFKSLINQKHTLSYGLNSLYYHLSPGSYLPNGDESLVLPRVLDSEEALESALYVSDTWNINSKLAADFGLRVSLFSAMAPFKFYANPEFRISGKYLISDRTTFKAGFNSMTQYIHLLSNTTSISPTDIWKLSDENIKPQKGWQAAAAIYSLFFDNKLEVSAEAYYKHMSNYLDYKSGAVLVMNPNIAGDVITTKGRAYGVEFMAKKPLGKLNGWISYTYSKTELREDGDRGINAVNRGEWYPAAYDKPHDFKLVGNYKFTHRYSISFNMDYSTGRPVTIPVGRYSYGGGSRLFYSDRNQYRIPDYFRLDLAVNVEPSHNLTHFTHFSFTVGVYNITGRKNAYSVYFDANRANIVKGYMLSIFGAPIPYINLNFKF